MNLFTEEVEAFVEFLIEHDLTADQFLFCLLLSSEAEGYQDLPDREQAMANFFRYYNTIVQDKENPVWAKQDLDDLVSKGFISRLPAAGEDSYGYQDFEVTREFLDLAFEKKDDLMTQFEEFWDVYPPRYVSDDGTKFNIKAVNKEEVWSVFQNKAKELDNPSIIIDSLKVAKNKDEVDCRIDKWLKSHQWEAYVDEIDEATEYSQTKQTVL